MNDFVSDAQVIVYIVARCAVNRLIVVTGRQKALIAVFFLLHICSIYLVLVYDVLLLKNFPLYRRLYESGSVLIWR